MRLSALSTKKSLIASIIFGAIFYVEVSGTPDAFAAGANFSYPSGRACTSSESWTFSNHFQAAYVKEYKDFLKTGKKSLRGFSEAVALRKVTKTPEEKLFSEFWMAHALLDAGETHVAYQGFLAIASTNPASINRSDPRGRARLRASDSLRASFPHGSGPTSCRLQGLHCRARAPVP